MNTEKLKAIIKDLKKNHKNIYPFLELTEQEMEYLKSKNVKIHYEFIELHHFLVDGTYKKLAIILEEGIMEKDKIIYLLESIVDFYNDLKIGTNQEESFCYERFTGYVKGILNIILEEDEKPNLTVEEKQFVGRIISGSLNGFKVAKQDHTLHFELNDNTKKLLNLLNTISEEKKEFNVEKFLKMKEQAKEINSILKYTSELIRVFLDDKAI